MKLPLGDELICNQNDVSFTNGGWIVTGRSILAWKMKMEAKIWIQSKLKNVQLEEKGDTIRGTTQSIWFAQDSHDFSPLWRLKGTHKRHDHFLSHREMTLTYIIHNPDLEQTLNGRKSWASFTVSCLTPPIFGPFPLSSFVYPVKI
jgi:hypothetical protein